MLVPVKFNLFVLILLLFLRNPFTIKALQVYVGFQSSLTDFSPRGRLQYLLNVLIAVKRQSLENLCRQSRRKTWYTFLALSAYLFAGNRAYTFLQTSLGVVCSKTESGYRAITFFCNSLARFHSLLSSYVDALCGWNNYSHTSIIGKPHI